jgi:hypothetical protein
VDPEPVPGVPPEKIRRDGEIMAIALRHEPAKDKWPDEDERCREIQRSIDKLRPEHPHVGRTCLESGRDRSPDPTLVVRSR